MLKVRSSEAFRPCPAGWTAGALRQQKTATLRRHPLFVRFRWTSVHQRVSSVSLRGVGRCRCAEVADNVLARLRTRYRPTSGLVSSVVFCARFCKRVEQLGAINWPRVRGTQRYTVTIFMLQVFTVPLCCCGCIYC